MNSKSESAEIKLPTKEQSEPVKKAVRARAKVPAAAKVEPASAEIEPAKAVRARAKVPASAEIEPVKKAVRARAKVPASAEIEPAKAVRARAKVPATAEIEPASAEIEPAKATYAGAKAPENVEAGLAPIYKIEKEGRTGLFTQKDLKTVIFCLWASTFTSIWMAYKAMNQMSNQNWNIILFGSVFFIGVTWFLAVRLKEGRNWARIATIIFAFLSILSILFDKSKYDWTILDLCVIGTDISVIMVLFSRQVSNWFRSGLGVNVPSPESHVKCPDCRELVLRDASKCRHCGCSLIPQ